MNPDQPATAEWSARVIAFYLPQFHPIPENDQWWGKGFTEWTAVARTKPLFRGHVQPKLPGELGFYDLRVPEVREQQATLAAEHGVEGFCYWHYWLGSGKRILERPFDEVLSSGKPNLPFCLGWANHDWKGNIMGAGRRCLMEQTYPGTKDQDAHFGFLLQAFQDPRYIRVDEKPLLYIYRPEEIPDAARYLQRWRDQACAAGLKGLFIVGPEHPSVDTMALGLDALHVSRHREISHRLDRKLRPLFRHAPLARRAFNLFRKYRLRRFPYAQAVRFMHKESYAPHEYPNITCNWDTTPRYGREAVIFTGATPELFGGLVREAVEKVKHRPREHRLIFLNSWNEWAEGNYIEPDAEFGRGRLEALRDALLVGPKCGTE